MTITEPAPRRSDYVEQIHGYTIMDPYRWMEDGDSDETKAYIDEHNAITDSWLHADRVKKIAEKVSREYPEHTYGVPRKYGQFWWWKKQEVDLKTEAEKTTFVRSTSYNDKDPEVVVDLNMFDETSSITFWGCDPTGRYWVGGVQSNGSDWQSVRIFDADKKMFLPETLEDVKFTFRYVFTADGEGFFYHVLPSNQHGNDGAYSSEMMYYHRLGTKQSEDVKVWSDETPGSLYIPATEAISDDEKYLIYTVANGTDPKSFLYYTDVESMKKGTHKFIAIDDSFTATYEYLCTIDDKWVFLSNRNAEKFNIVTWHESAGFEVLVPEHETDALKYASAVGSKLLLVYMTDASDRVVLRSADGSMSDVKSSNKYASLELLHGTINDENAFVQVESYNAPAQVYQISSKTGVMSKLDNSDLELASEDYVCERHKYNSTDGKEIGMFVSYYKSARTETNPPVLLYAYGGFAHAEQPRFEPFWATFMRDFGGVLCVANIRGGGENGLAWWKEAKGVKRQVAFDDFKSAARYIVSSGLTTVDRLAINGMSNGGLLTGACTVQDPQLFSCVVCDVGIHDLTRYDQFTFGGLWKGEYGDPSVKEDYDKLLQLSPYANIKKQTYPSIMITTADHDDRVVPAHSLKFAAELLYQNPNNANPIILRVNKGTGHMLGKSASTIIHEASEKLEFIRRSLGIAVDFM